MPIRDMHPWIRETGRWAKRGWLRANRFFAADKALANARLNQREIWHGRARLASFPREIQVGTNWTCNLRCFFCRRETTDRERLAALKPDQREIPEGVLERLLAILPYAEVFTLTPLGEPLLYSGLDRLLERCASAASGNLHLTTNGNAISEERARSLVEAGTRRIYVSIDSADPVRYAEMRAGGSLDKVAEGLERLRAWKARLNRQWPEIVFASTFMRRNIGDLEGLLEFARRHEVKWIAAQLMELDDLALAGEALDRDVPAAAFALRQARETAERLGIELTIHPALARLIAAHGAAQPSPAASPPPSCLSLMEKCLYPWTFLVVDTDGEARPCCWVSLRYGNLAQQPFGEVWNSAAAQELRREFIADRIPDCCRGKHCRVDA
ncbi:MAG: Cyclic pyranopterin monophosphate synthase 1 [candidate division BRC1 bacterium ADurb.BinA364]|nr:MAG: Cyclic pyranopterin monophosphate synthase 1 [candidate division BRC1 bacterium ADurb.BinA364]